MPSFIRYCCFVFALFLMSSPDGYAQVNRIGAGFAFSTPLDFNNGETGNPGIVVKTWVILNKPSTLQLVPSLTAFNRYRSETGSSTFAPSIISNYMFQGDLDLQFTVFQEGNVKLAPFAGGNILYLTSKFESEDREGNETRTDTSDFALGGNLGAALELRMTPKWDFIIAGKYTFSSYSQFVISVLGVYYFKSRRRAYRR